MIKEKDEEMEYLKEVVEGLAEELSKQKNINIPQGCENFRNEIEVIWKSFQKDPSTIEETKVKAKVNI
eukprot:CAMPEP_0115037872 /NCGR_PEP_ID=MMETSP0216-20121206/43067_1 /TAXON_ID=223996 /ORGANISM="Protocruzia adherens, Strain Boccale" /LENGTH=67 /DNA_ID=CAMNT_0002418155 /DNA_START=158 /DNA_END=361 /DNA_ORIENTATION=-